VRDIDRQGTPIRAALAPLVAALALVVAAPAGATGVSAAAHRCSNPAFASGELVVTRVGCDRAERIIHRSLKHQPCQPSKRDQQSGRGCYGHNRVGHWRCHGLYPGEGFDLHCRSGKRRIHGGAGG
jgi:hypothetical protein